MPTRRGRSHPGDVVLIHVGERPASFARIEDVRVHERAGWYLCDLLVLGVPSQPVTWVLQRDQIDGEPFTMGGRPVRIERLPALGSQHASRNGSKEPRDRTLDLAAKPAAAAARSPRSRRRRASNDKVVQLFPRAGKGETQ